MCGIIRWLLSLPLEVVDVVFVRVWCSMEVM
jgi:hypothetical protein